MPQRRSRSSATSASQGAGGHRISTITPALSFGEDGGVLGIAEAEVANGEGFNLKRAAEPRGERWCYLRIDEEEEEEAPIGG